MSNAVMTKEPSLSEQLEHIVKDRKFLEQLKEEEKSNFNDKNMIALLEKDIAMLHAIEGTILKSINQK